MAPHTLPLDITNRWLLSEDKLPTDAKLATLIDDAEDVVRVALAEREMDLDALVAATTVPLARVKRIVSGIVIRHLHNPAGVRYEQETTGPFTGGRTYIGNTTGIYVTDAEVDELLGIDKPKSGRAFQVDTTPASFKPRTYDSERVWT